MMLGAGINPDDRVLVMAPTRKDALTADSLLRDEGIAVEICHSFDATLDKLARGAAAIVIPEEAVTSPNTARLLTFLRQQPPWSDLPILVLTRMGADSAASNEAVRTLGNVTLLERPVRVAALLTAVRTALRARQRQYQIREHLSSARGPKRRCAMPTSAKTSSWRRSVTSCGIHWPRSYRGSMCCA